MRSSSEIQLRDALIHLLRLEECLVVFLMSKFERINQEDPFEVPPLIELPEPSL